MILLVTQPDDPPVLRAEAELIRRGATVVRFDPDSLAADARLSMSYGTGGERRLALKIDGLWIDLDTVQTVWYRRPSSPQANYSVSDPGWRGLIEQESSETLFALWDMMLCPFLPATPWVLHRARRKPFQLAVAQSIGFEIPPTCVTSDAGELIAFYRTNDGRCISKMIGPKSMALSGLSRRFARFTEPMTFRDIRHAYSARHCPTLVQGYVKKSLELRITVVGTRVFAVEIHSQRDPHARHDWRHAANQWLPFVPHRLPPDLEARVVALVEKLGLRYGALDMVLTPDGRYVFIEINPNGEYDWVEHKTGLPITEAICDLLLDHQRRALRSA